MLHQKGTEAPDFAQLWPIISFARSPCEFGFFLMYQSFQNPTPLTTNAGPASVARVPLSYRATSTYPLKRCPLIITKEAATGAKSGALTPTCITITPATPKATTSSTSGMNAGCRALRPCQNQYTYEHIFDKPPVKISRRLVKTRSKCPSKPSAPMIQNFK